MSFLFNQEKHEAFNLAKVAILLNANNGKIVYEYWVYAESKFLGFKSPFPEGYNDYANRMAQKYGLQYSVVTQKGKIVYGDYPSSSKKREYRVIESLQSSHNAKELLSVAKQMAQTNAENIFLSYKDEFYQKMKNSDVVENMTKKLIDQLSLGQWYASIEPKDLYKPHSGLNIRLEIKENECGFRYGPDGKFVNIHSVLCTEGVWITYQKCGYGKLPEQQRKGMAMVLQEKLYKFFSKQYPTAIIILYETSDGILGMNIMDMEENHLSQWV